MTIQSLPAQARPPAEPKKWTVLIWSACDNDLYECCVNDLDKSERGSSNPDINVVAQVDHRLNPDPQGPHGVQRLELHPDGLPLLHSPVKADLGDSDMASPKNLADFIQWGIKNYPAENYWLVISDHGDAWKGAALDEGHHSWMSLPQIESALHEARQQTGSKLDLLSFDCCYMASTEVAHQLKDETHYMVASEEAMGYLGLPYEPLLGQASQLSPRQLAERLVQASQQNPEDIPTFTAVDMEKVPALSEAVKQLGQAITASPLNGSELRAVLADTQAFWEYRDIQDLASRLAERAPSDPRLQQASLQVQAALQEAVIAEQHSTQYPGAHGLQIEVNRDTDQARQARYGQGAIVRSQAPWLTSEGSYAETAFARDSQWAQAIEKIHS